MKIQVRLEYMQDWKGKYFEDKFRYHDSSRLVEVDANLLTEKQIDHLLDCAKQNQKHEGARALVIKINAYRAVRANPTGHKVTKLETLPAAVKAYMEKSQNKWLFKESDDGYPMPYYVVNAEYHPRRDQRPAYVNVNMLYERRGARKNATLTLHKFDLGKTVAEMFNERDYFLETEAMVNIYWEDVALLKKWSPLLGHQFNCVGEAYIKNGYYSSNKIAMEREGRPTKVVMDESGEEEDRSSTERGGVASTLFWTNAVPSNEEEDDATEEAKQEDSVNLPVHPYVRIFDLQHHKFATTHARNLSEYAYDKAVIDKLILPPNTKDLINILVRGSAEVMEDIISGKTGGTIVISTGPPGTGKTLTAEVFSEEIERPLYVVQCSQLGTDEVALENALQAVLHRASRWGAILLIDEADVYVRARGEDIQQNAIVGVFLRVLEYYRGVLFLTSNRETIIDDAVMSRATAWVRYDYPDKKDLAAIWTVLSKQYSAGLSKETILTLVEKFPRLAGRNVKAFLKLAKKLIPAKRHHTLDDAKLFEYVAGFLDLPDQRPRPGPGREEA